MSLCQDCRTLLFDILLEYSGIQSNWRKGSPDETHEFIHTHGSFISVIQNNNACYLCCRLSLFQKPALQSDNVSTNNPNRQLSSSGVDGSASIDLPPQIEAKIVRTHRSPTDVFLEIKASMDHIVTGWTCFVLGHDKPFTRDILLQESDLTNSLRFSTPAEFEVYNVTVSSDRGLTEAPIGSADESHAASAELSCSHEESLCACRVAKIREWMTTCNDSHQDCFGIHSNRRGVAVLPKRLVQVSDSGKVARLVDSAVLSAESPIRYATLSHCWGEKTFLTLSQENLAEFHRRIPVLRLGKTFREALVLCGAVGISFIWIDSLCIIQDSAGSIDWLTEAAKMHHVYGNSELNLVATGSQQCSDGLFTPMIDISAASRRLSISCPAGLLLEDGGIGLEYLHEYCYHTAPLLQRGWVLQETTLAPRNLHWTKSQLFWQCRHVAVSEHGRSMLYAKKMRWKFMAWEDMSRLSTVDELDSFWKKTIHDFTGCQTTKQDDRYYALAGLAAIIGNRYNELGVTTNYATGCWDHNLVSGLLWENTSGINKLRSEQPNVDSSNGIYVPSWSCLKSGTNAYPYILHEPGSKTATIANLCVTLEKPDQSFGPVRSAFLDLVTRTFKIRLEHVDGAFNLPHMIRLESSNGKIVQFAESDARRARFGDLAVLTCDDVDHDSGIGSTASVKCAVLLQTMSPAADLRRKCLTIAALALLPAKNQSSEKVLYRRFGLVRFRTSQGNSTLELLQSFFADGNLPDETLTIV